MSKHRSRFNSERYSGGDYYPVDAKNFPLPIEEVGLPESELNLDRLDTFNNHHTIWTHERMGRLAITRVWHNLDQMQVQMPWDVHSRLHQMYTAQKRLPKLEDIMEVLSDAYLSEDPMRFGSARNPQYRAIGSDTWRQLTEEYAREK